MTSINDHCTVQTPKGWNILYHFLLVFLLSTQVFVFWVHYWDPHHFVESFMAKVLHEDFGMISYLPMIVDLLVVFAMFSLCYVVVTLALGSQPRQGLGKLWAKRGSLGMKASVREWTLTLPRELPPWELESRWSPECSESDCKGQNPMDWRFFCTIEKLLKHKCLKWACMIHLEIWNTSYGQKKGWEVIWLPTIKNQESTQFPCVQVACDIPLESSRRGLQLCFRPHLNQRSTRKVMGPQSRGSPNFGNVGTPILGVPRQNAIWMWALWRGTKYTIRGKMVGSPKSGLWWVLWVRVVRGSS